MSFPVPLPSTFMPLPLAIMIPFMGIQSGVMAQQFGMNFQYGKRKISAMSNEEFNKLTPQQMQLDFSNQITGMIPTFEKSLQEMRPFQRMIFIEMIAAFKEAVQLGLDIAGAGLGINTGLPSIPKDKFTPGQAEVDRGAFVPGVSKVPLSRRVPVTKQKVGVTFERTLAEAQADTSRSRGTGIIKTEASKRGAGQTQKLERAKLMQIIASLRRSLTSRNVNARTKNNNRNRLIATQKQLEQLLNRYRF